MIHTAPIDDSAVAEKRFTRDFRHIPNGIELENPAVTGIVPKGYMTGDEFERRAIESIDKYCIENGLL